MFDSGPGTPDGFILLGLGDEAPAVRRALTRPPPLPAPVVLLSRYVPELPCSWVSVDHVRAAALLTDHLVERGYRTIALVSHGLQTGSWQRQRRRGYLESLARHGLPADPLGGPVDLDTGDLQDIAGRLAASYRRAPARGRPLFVAAEWQAIGVRRELARRGPTAPEHYGLAGYDNIADEMVGASYGLTSIGFSRERMGALALRIARELCDTPPRSSSTSSWPPSCTCAAPPSGPPSRPRSALPLSVPPRLPRRLPRPPVTDYAEAHRRAADGTAPPGAQHPRAGGVRGTCRMGTWQLLAERLAGGGRARGAAAERRGRLLLRQHRAGRPGPGAHLESGGRLGAHAAERAGHGPVLQRPRPAPGRAPLRLRGHRPLLHRPGRPLGGQQAAYILDPVAGWQRVADLAFGRWYPSVICLPDGRMLVASGTDNGVTAQAVEVYDPFGGWEVLPPSADRDLPLYPRLHVLPSGEVAFAGQGAATAILNLEHATSGARCGPP